MHLVNCICKKSPLVFAMQMSVKTVNFVELYLQLGTRYDCKSYPGRNYTQLKILLVPTKDLASSCVGSYSD